MGNSTSADSDRAGEALPLDPRARMPHSMSTAALDRRRQKSVTFNRNNSVSVDLKPSKLNNPFQQMRRE
eukprot:9198453-Prorocentrum_lima.AAC.1